MLNNVFNLFYKRAKEYVNKKYSKTISNSIWLIKQTNETTTSDTKNRPTI
jgi:hypothetical protein